MTTTHEPVQCVDCGRTWEAEFHNGVEASEAEVECSFCNGAALTEMQARDPEYVDSLRRKDVYQWYQDRRN